MNESDRFNGHSSCYTCGSSDALGVWDTHAYCFSCCTRFEYTVERAKPTAFVKHSRYGSRIMTEGTNKIAVGGEAKTLTDRKLSKATLDKYGVTLGYDSEGKILQHFYPYYDEEGTHVATKVRIVDPKDFFISGDIKKTCLFGQHLLPKGGKFITLCEGEIDAMSNYEMLGYPGIGCKSSSQALADVKQHYDYINSFDNIIIAFDNDEAGQKAADKVARVFKAGKVKIVNINPFNDINEFLQGDKRTAWEKAWWSAASFQIDGIVAGNSLWDSISKEEKHTSVLYPWEGLNKKLYGFRTSEMVTVTAGTGVGKTTLLKHIALWIKNNTPKDVNVGLLMLEETTRETGMGLMSASAGIPFHLPDATYTPEQKKKAFDDSLGSGRFFMHDHFGSTSIDNIIDKVHKLATQYDCKYIILDHISIIVSDQQNGDERRALDEIATKLKTFCTNRDICLFIVCHLKRISGKPAEEGGQISLSDLRGTAGIGQLSNIVIGLERDIQSEDSNESNRVKVRVLKNRFSGKAGIACELEFDYANYKFVEVEPLDTPADSFKVVDIKGGK